MVGDVSGQWESAMQVQERARARTAAAIASAVLVGGVGGGLGVVPGTIAGAQAATASSDYVFKTTAYGTRAQLNGLDVASGRTALAWIACTNRLGKQAENSLASTALPADPSDPGSPTILSAGASHSTNRTFRDLDANIAAASQGTSSVASLALGLDGAPQLALTGLTTTSTAWATKGGRLRADNEVSVGDIELRNVTPDGEGTPLDDLLDAVNGAGDPLLQLLEALRQNGGGIEVPGLGVVHIGDYDDVRSGGGGSWAFASSVVLRVVLHGSDLASPDDDVVVNVGRSFARIDKGVPHGIMNGQGAAFEGTVAGGMLGFGELGQEPLPCTGTKGRVLTNSVAELDAGGAGQVVLSGVEGRVYGVQGRRRTAKAWTDGRLASITIGPLELRGVSGRVNARMDRRGRVSKNFRGSTIGELVYDGVSQGSFGIGTADQIPPEAREIPGVARLEFFTRSKSRRGAEMTAVTITLLDEAGPLASTIRLGHATVGIRRPAR